MNHLETEYLRAVSPIMYKVILELEELGDALEKYPLISQQKKIDEIVGMARKVISEIDGIKKQGKSNGRKEE